MFKQIFAATILSAGLSMAFASDGLAGQGGRHEGHGARRSVEQNHGDQDYQTKAGQIVVERKLYRRVINGALPVRRLLDLDRHYRGYRIKKVMIKIKPKRSFGHLRLLVNGHTVDRARIKRDKWITLRTDDDKTLGRDLKSLQLHVRGQVFIKNIKVLLAEPRRFRRRAGDGGHHHDPLQRILRVILNDVNNRNAAL